MNFPWVCLSLVLSLALLSACAPHNDTSEKGRQPDSALVDNEARDKINALIIQCALPSIYYSWQTNAEFTLNWQTGDNSINVRNSALQPCVERGYATRSFYFRSGLAGKVNISAR